MIHVPTSYTGMTRVPLLIDMHGSGQNAANQLGTSGWSGKADKTGFIVVYPNALNARWNVWRRRKRRGRRSGRRLGDLSAPHAGLSIIKAP
jgi:poly(3-hydroxybutyrate) depolymerase